MIYRFSLISCSCASHVLMTLKLYMTVLCLLGNVIYIILSLPHTFILQGSVRLIPSLQTVYPDVPIYQFRYQVQTNMQAQTFDVSVRLLSAIAVSDIYMHWYPMPYMEMLRVHQPYCSHLPPTFHYPSYLALPLPSSPPLPPSLPLPLRFSLLLPLLIVCPV